MLCVYCWTHCCPSKIKMSCFRCLIMYHAGGPVLSGRSDQLNQAGIQDKLVYSQIFRQSKFTFSVTLFCLFFFVYCIGNYSHYPFYYEHFYSCPFVQLSNQPIVWQQQIQVKYCSTYSHHASEWEKYNHGDMNVGVKWTGLDTLYIQKSHRE